MSTMETFVHWLAEPQVAIWWISVGAFWLGWSLRELSMPPVEYYRQKRMKG